MIYPCFEAKKLSEPSARRLQELEEARGKLLRVVVLEGFAVAVFPFAEIVLPGELEPQLREMVGNRIACLRFENRYLVRNLGAEDAAR